MEDITNVLGKRKKTDNPLEGSEKRPKVVSFTLGQLEEAGKQLYPDLAFMSCTNECGDSVLMHLSMVCPTTPTWGKYGDNVGDMQNQACPRGGALSRPKIKC